MMKLLKSSLGLLLLSLLAACGGGGGSAGTPVLGGGGTTVPLSDLVVVLSAASVPNNGITGATATITAVDANRNALPNVPITLSADNGGVLTSQVLRFNPADGSVTPVVTSSPYQVVGAGVPVYEGLHQCGIVPNWFAG